MTPIKCNKCGGENFVKKGISYGKQRFQCKFCKSKRVSGADGFEWEGDITDIKDYMFIDGVSKLVKDADGNNTWVKAKVDQKKRIELLKSSFMDAFGADIKAPVVKVSGKKDSEICTVYPIGDVHLGMLSWAMETGNDSDLSITRDLVLNALSSVANSATKSETAYIFILGDFFHTDNRSNKTEMSGHNLDVDSRYGKMCRAGTRLLREIIDIVRKKHKNVYFHMAHGNHDYHSSLLSSIALESYYENDKNITILPNENPFYYTMFGKNLFGVTHGTGLKWNKMQGIMCADVPEMWGKSLYRKWFLGHIHHTKSEEDTASDIEYFTKLNFGDYWSHSAGYRASIKLQAIEYHIDGGEVRRVTENIKL